MALPTTRRPRHRPHTRRSRGHPGTLLSLLSDAPQPVAPGVRRLLEALGRERLLLETLAERLGLSDHALLDVAEPLLDQGVLEASENGAELWARR